MPNVVLTKLFDVRNGNGVGDGTTTYPDATLIAFKDAASKTAVLNAFAAKFGFVPGGAQTKQQFFNTYLQNLLKQVYREQKVAEASQSAGTTAATSADAELP